MTITFINWATHYISGTGDPSGQLAVEPGVQFWDESSKSLYQKLYGMDANGWVKMTQA